MEKKFGKWFVYENGDLEYDNYYCIHSDRLKEDDWIIHLSAKGWIDWNEFIPAWLYAMRLSGIKKVTIKVAY